MVLNEISARIAKYDRYDKGTAEELKQLRNNVRDVFNKGLDPGDELMDQLYFLDSKTKDLVDKMTMNYERVVTPNDFKQIANIMSEHLGEQVPILGSFTKFFGRLAEDFLKSAKPSNSDFDWTKVVKTAIRGEKSRGYTVPDGISRILGMKAGEPLSEKVLSRMGFWKPDGTLAELINGVDSPDARRTGAKFFKHEYTTLNDAKSVLKTYLKNGKVELLKEKKISEVEIFYANKLPKSWTNVPWVNFDGKVIEQNFTQAFEERLTYKDKYGNWVNNILQVPQKTESSWWDQVLNKSGKINDIGDLSKARTAYAVNGNHANDATVVKNFHLWGKANDIPTSTIHDAFFTNIVDMLRGREALRKIYADTLKQNVVLNTLMEMKSRGLPQELYIQYLEEAIDKGLIPVVGKSRIGGKLVTESDILRASDIVREVPLDFKEDLYWYGVG